MTRESTMITRLADVIYWTANALVLLLIPYFVWAWYVGPERERSGAVLVGSIGVPGIWLIGRAVRYVLAGK
jgi:hypothetical protein